MTTTTKGERKGGLRVDPAVAEWQQGAATNVAALTKKERRDRERVRVKADLPVEVKTAVERVAGEVETSESQIVAFLVAWGLKRLRDGDRELVAALEGAKTWAKALRFKHDLSIPNNWLEEAEK